MGKIKRSLASKLVAEADTCLSFSRKDTFIEKVLDAVLSTAWPETSAGLLGHLSEEIRALDTASTRVVVFGGGTGLSSIAGGNSKLAHWSLNPFVGLKQVFKNIKLVVCTTDDGGSTGKIIQKLPIMALGDLRKACLSMITPESLRKAYRADDGEARSLAGILQTLLNFRFEKEEDTNYFGSPFALMTPSQQASCPVPLREQLESICRYIERHPLLSKIGLQGNCLGNLFLLGCIYRAMESSRDAKEGEPSPEEIIKGMDDFAGILGIPARTIYPATPTQGELLFLYNNGVMVSGQYKAAVSQRNVPIERVMAKYRTRPYVAPDLIGAIREADVIILAPGSLYSSTIPIFQIKDIYGAVHANTKAMKLLVANFWVQKGETDRAVDGRKNFYVSDLVKAYHNNFYQGIKNMVQQVLVSDLREIPGNIFQRYAVEGKTPIYLDKNKVRDFGFEPIEGAIFSREKLDSDLKIQHDPDKISLAVKVLLYFKEYLRTPFFVPSTQERMYRLKGRGAEKSYISERMSARFSQVEQLEIPDKTVRDFFPRLLWNNRDISIDHLQCFKGVRVIEPEHWGRRTEWDKILGYFDPEDGFIKIRQDLFKLGPARLEEDLMIGIGESVLGAYFKRKAMRPFFENGDILGKIFEIELAPLKKRRSYLTDAQLRHYLYLAGMEESSINRDIFRKVLNVNETFTPCGLFFGLFYAWYLNNRYGGEMEYEMSLVKQEISDLMPKQRKEFQQRSELIRFFREVVFNQKIARISY